jgi:hypothetical protein
MAYESAMQLHCRAGCPCSGDRPKLNNSSQGPRQHRCAAGKHNALRACNSAGAHWKPKPAPPSGSCKSEELEEDTSVEIKPKDRPKFTMSRPRTFTAQPAHKSTSQSLETGDNVTWRKNLRWESCSEQGSRNNHQPRNHAQKPFNHANANLTARKCA